MLKLQTDALNAPWSENQRHHWDFNNKGFKQKKGFDSQHLELTTRMGLQSIAILSKLEFHTHTTKAWENMECSFYTSMLFDFPSVEISISSSNEKWQPSHLFWVPTGKQPWIAGKSIICSMISHSNLPIVAHDFPMFIEFL